MNALLNRIPNINITGVFQAFYCTAQYKKRYGDRGKPVGMV